MDASELAREIAPYHVVLPHQELAAEPTAYVLDTNIVIDIERFYTGHASMRIAAAGHPARAGREGSAPASHDVRRAPRRAECRAQLQRGGIRGRLPP